MKLVLFDGVCNLCNNSVQFVLERDEKAQFQFASLQSETGQKILKQHDLPAQKFDSVVLVEGDKIYLQSTAALRIAKELNGIWAWLYAFIIVPKPIRDVVYNFIGRNRYRWFGKQESCWLPTPELKQRFLS